MVTRVNTPHLLEARLGIMPSVTATNGTLFVAVVTSNIGRVRKLNWIESTHLLAQLRKRASHAGGSPTAEARPSSGASPDCAWRTRSSRTCGTKRFTRIVVLIGGTLFRRDSSCPAPCKTTPIGTAITISTTISRSRSGATTPLITLNWATPTSAEWTFCFPSGARSLASITAAAVCSSNSAVTRLMRRMTRLGLCPWAAWPT